MEQIRKIFKMAADEGLSAADLYTLASLKDLKKEYGETFCASIAKDRLVKEGWLTNDENHSERSIALLSSMTKLFKPVKSKKPEIEVDSNMIRKYNSIFPRMKIPTSNLQAQSNEKELLGKFKKFFTLFGTTYSWDIILRATEKYINDRESEKYNYMRTSSYFIAKMNKDGSWIYDLATWCDAELNGNDDDEKQEYQFETKVV